MKIFFHQLKRYLVFLKKENKNYTNKNEVISNISQMKLKFIQEDLPFIKTDTNQAVNKTKFIIPSIDLLKIPSKKEREVPI